MRPSSRCTSMPQRSSHIRQSVCWISRSCGIYFSPLSRWRRRRRLASSTSRRRSKASSASTNSQGSRDAGPHAHRVASAEVALAAHALRLVEVDVPVGAGEQAHLAPGAARRVDRDRPGLRIAADRRRGAHLEAPGLVAVHAGQGDAGALLRVEVHADVRGAPARSHRSDGTHRRTRSCGTRRMSRGLLQRCAWRLLLRRSILPTSRCAARSARRLRGRPADRAAAAYDARTDGDDPEAPLLRVLPARSRPRALPPGTRASSTAYPQGHETRTRRHHRPRRNGPARPR